MNKEQLLQIINEMRSEYQGKATMAWVCLEGNIPHNALQSYPEALNASIVWRAKEEALQDLVKRLNEK